MSQYLGDISAYALAVSQGYTGTEEEYAELMASYATVGQTAVTAAQTATTKASEAATSATTATNKASEATTAATTATTKAGEASTSASTATSAKDTAVSAASTATTKATEATTAAATATSAKTDAVAANTAAQSAKTAAQTAQTGAETAAASVEASAAQITQNATDISQLKSDLSNIAGTIVSYTLVLQDNRYINKDNGNIDIENGWVASDYVDIGEGVTKLKTKSTSSDSNSKWNAFYDANKTYISGFSTFYDTVDVPATAKYFRVSYDKRYTLDIRPYHKSIDELDEIITETNVRLNNALDAIKSWNVGGYVSKNDGKIYSAETSTYTNFIPVSTGDYLYIGSNMIDKSWNAFYDANHEYLSGFTADGTITIPATAKFMRLSSDTTHDVIVLLNHKGDSEGIEFDSEIDATSAVVGYLHPDDGETYETTYKAYVFNLKMCGVKKGTVIDSVNAFVGMKVFTYDKTGTFIECLQGADDSKYDNKCVIPYDCYIRVMLKYNNGFTFSETSKTQIFAGICIDYNSKDWKTPKYGDMTTYQEISDTIDPLTNWFSSAYIYQKYDELMALYPNVITRNLLGYASQSDGTDDTTLPIYEYVIDGSLADYEYVKQYDYSTGIDFYKPKKVLLTSGIHGAVEIADVYVLYRVIKDALNDDNGAGEILRNATLKVIPCTNPYAVEHNTVLTATGTNINRNLGFTWDNQQTPLDPDTFGSAPYSANESKIYRDWLQANSDASLHIDCHTVQQTCESPYFYKMYAYMFSPNKNLLEVYNAVIRQCYAYFKRFGTDLSQQNVLFNAFVPQATTTNEAFYVAGIKNTCILEFSTIDIDNGGVKNTERVLRIGYEEYINVIRALVHEFC